MSFSRYPDYKKTDAEFIGDIPTHWKVEPLKRCAEVFPSNVDKKSVDGQVPVKLCNYTDVYYNQAIIEDIGFMSATATPEQIKRFKLRKDDVVFTKDSESADDIGIAAYVSADMDGVLYGYHLSVARPGKALKGKFLKRAFDSQEMRSHFAVSANGLTRVGLGQYAVDNAPVALPPLDEQQKIAAFLDHETAKIDALIAEQQRLIELLKEKRQAVISHAVTKGLNPNAPMKDSGVEWLGEVPAHWIRCRLKNVSPFITVGIVVNPSSYVSESGMPFIYGGEVREGLIDYKKARKITAEDSKKNNKTMLEAGDLITVRVGYPGVTSVVPKECEGGNCASVMLIKKGKYDSYWLSAVMNSDVVRHQVEIVEYGAAQKQFNIADAVEFWLYSAPVYEQSQIANFIASQNEVFNNLIGEAEKSTELLRERRSALISAAVTGKIDVRDWQPSKSTSPEPVLQAAEEAAGYG